jgi:hypothetical protein
MKQACLGVVIAAGLTLPAFGQGIDPDAAQTSSDRQAYCVNGSADFYLYTDEPCRSGYQLGAGDCRKTNGRIVAVPREECLAQAGTVELPFENGFPPRPAPRR